MCSSRYLTLVYSDEFNTEQGAKMVCSFYSEFHVLAATASGGGAVGLPSGISGRRIPNRGLKLKSPTVAPMNSGAEPNPHKSEFGDVALDCR